jgi:hypothetical protein
MQLQRVWAKGIQAHVMSRSQLLSRWPAFVGAAVALATATTLLSRSGDLLGACAAFVCAAWVGWLSLAVFRAVSEALRPRPSAHHTLRTSLSAANDDVEFAVVVRLRR